jgi:hypothetical protein
MWWFEMMKFLALCLLLIGAAAQARWKPEYAGSAYAKWFESQYDAHGGSCCAEADGHFYDGSYTLNADGSVTIGEYRLESYKVLHSQNPTGHAVWWYVGEGDHHIDYCFSPGALT